MLLLTLQIASQSGHTHRSDACLRFHFLISFGIGMGAIGSFCIDSCGADTVGVGISTTGVFCIFGTFVHAERTEPTMIAFRQLIQICIWV